MIKEYLEYTSKEIDSHSSKYDNFHLLGNFDSKPTEKAMKSFCQIHNLKNLLDKPTGYKTPTNLVCVDLIMTNGPRNYQKSYTFETGLSHIPQNDPNSTKIIFCNRNLLSVVNTNAPLWSRFIQV